MANDAFHTCCVVQMLLPATTESLAASAGSEDNTIRLWNHAGQCKQVISFPGCVWSLAFLSSGDLVAGVSDSRAYVLSGDAARHAPNDVLAAFADSVSQFKSQSAPQERGTGMLLNGVLSNDQMCPTLMGGRTCQRLLRG
jgi:WD40 repeat protein